MIQFRLLHLCWSGAALAVLLVPALGHAALLGPEQRITASDADNSDGFGHAVDIDGDVAVIGAPGDDQEATNAGAAYVFRRSGDTWVQEQKLTAETDANQFDGFGSNVAVDRELIVVGSPDDDEAGNDAGAAYVFEWNGSTWVRNAKLLPNDPSNSGDEFGTAVDISTDVPDEDPPNEVTTIAIGAPRADVFQGVVFMFLRNSIGTWDPIGRLSDSDSLVGGNEAGETGTALAIRGDRLVMGAPLDDQFGNNTGAVYVFGRSQIVSSWTESSKSYPTDPVPGDMYGAAVDVDRLFGLYTVVIGAPSPQNTGTAGRVFIFDGTSNADPIIFTAGADTDGFGSAVAIDGDHIVVGAPGDDQAAENSGAVYFFLRDMPGHWLADGQLIASDAGGQKAYGTSVAFRSTVIVGGPEDEAFTPGAAYVQGYLGDPVFSDGFDGGNTVAGDTFDL
ncbi:MAG: FG-GAP repeat protein [Rhodanobacteraceae bacterium]